MKIRNIVLLIAVIAMMSTGLTPAFGQTAEPNPCDGQAGSCRAGEEASAPLHGVIDDAVVDDVTAEKLPEGVFVVRVYYNAAEDSQLLTGFDLFEYNNREERYFLVAVDRADLARLRSLGFRTELDPLETANFALLATPLAQQGEWIETEGVGIESIPGYTCYRTVEETYAAAQALATAHPDLATWTDVGDSWEKSVGQPDGYDMMVLKLTNAAIPGPKPKLFATASIHAREYTPAELATRFAEYLVNNYGTDADATWILDHHEVHLMLHTNPDGRKEAEAGRSWRKNTNENYCGVTSTSRGADLNRNFSFYWNTCSGCSSGVPCDATYRGPSAGSEPETQAVQNYLLSIFPDQRADSLSSPAPADATGVYIDLHSYSQLVLWPWGMTATDAPNGAALQTLGRKFAYFNSYTPQQSYDLYGTDGSTTEFAYGNQGVAAYTFELGTAFFQACSTFEGTIYPTNLNALIYAAKVARTPYLTPAGPDALNLTVSPTSVTSGAPVTLSATINDTRYRSGTGEATQNIAAAEYYVDTPPWQAGAVTHAMTASDGSFNSTTEGVTASVNTSGLATGKHILFVRGQDAAGNWGAFSAVFLTITEPASQSPTADSQEVTTAEDTPSSITLTGSDPENDPLTFSVTGGPSHGTLSGAAPELTYTPAANYYGPDSFTFVANDGYTNSAPAAVNITVTPVNDDAPVADAQSVTTQQDAALAILLTGSDADGDTLSFTVEAGPNNGTLSGTAPDLVYTPAPGYTGPDSFTFVVSDVVLSSAPAAVSITVNPPGPVTVFFDDFETDLGWIRNPSGSDTATLGVWERADPEAVDYYGYKQLGTTVSGSYDLVTGPLAGSSAGSYDLDGGVTSIRSPGIALPAGSEVTLSFSYYLANYTNSSTADYLRVKVVGATTQTVFEELGAADDDDAAWETFSGSLDAFGGQTIYLLIEAADASTASLVEAAVDDVLITATGGGSPNQAPSADPQSVSTAEDTALPIVLTGSDGDGDPLTFSVTGGPSHGTLSGTAPSLTFTPAPNYHGPDSFSFVVNDGVVDSMPATIDIAVTPVNDAPVAAGQSVTTPQDTSIAIALAGSDVDDDALVYSVVAQPTHGALSGTAPSLTYTPASGYSGADSFTFKVNDGAVDSAPATVSITITPAVTGPKLYLGSSTAGTAGGVAFEDEDILIKDMSTGAWSLFVDGSDIGLANTDIDAFELQADGSLLISFDTAFTLSGFTTVDDSDILRFTPASTGATTAGTWSWYFDGSDVGLSTSDEDIDAFTVLPDGRLLISTLGNVSVTGASGADEDLLVFTPAQLGATTSGTWAMYFDGSDVGLSSTSNEDVNGAWVDAAGKIYLTTLGAFSVTGASGDGSDVFVCTPGSLGSTTTCTWAMYWDGSANGFTGEVTDSLSIVQ